MFGGFFALSAVIVLVGVPLVMVLLVAILVVLVETAEWANVDLLTAHIVAGMAGLVAWVGLLAASASVEAGMFATFVIAEVDGDLDTAWKLPTVDEDEAHLLDK